MKARADRVEQAVKGDVRPRLVARDGHCRLAGTPLGRCDALRSEWAHLRARAHTRGEAPERRHNTRESMMLCGDVHHYALDKGTGRRRLRITPLTDRGADGPCRFELNGVIYEESERVGGIE